MIPGNPHHGSTTVLEKNLGRTKDPVFHSCILQPTQRGIQREGEFQKGKEEK